MVEAPSNATKRIELKEDLLLHGVTMAMGDIRNRLKEREYKINNCLYECVMRESMAQNIVDIYGIDL